MGQSKNVNANTILGILRKFRWQYLSPAQVLTARGGVLAGVVLDEILAAQLSVINSFYYKDSRHTFSQRVIRKAIHALKRITEEGHSGTAENMYERLTVGSSETQAIYGDRKAYNFRYIDWQDLENNVFHVTDRFLVSDDTGASHVPIVLFVNGIPLGIVDDARGNVKLSVDEVVERMVQYQTSQVLSSLFKFIQVLVAVGSDGVKYGTSGLPASAWKDWIEDRVVRKLKKLAMSTSGSSVAAMNDPIRLGLCARSRFMQFVYAGRIVTSDLNVLAGYDHVFALNKALARMRKVQADGTRKGGIIWFTPESSAEGDILPIVVFAKAIARDESVAERRVVVIVTDRADVQDLIYKLFVQASLPIMRAGAVLDLAALLGQAGTRHMVTTWDSFEQAIKRNNVTSNHATVFMIADECDLLRARVMQKTSEKLSSKVIFVCIVSVNMSPESLRVAGSLGGFIYRFTDVLANPEQGGIKRYQNAQVEEPDQEQNATVKYQRISKPKKQSTSPSEWTTPESILNNVQASEFFNLLMAAFHSNAGNSDIMDVEIRIAEASLQLTSLVEGFIIVDWKVDILIKRSLENALEDFVIQWFHSNKIPTSYTLIDDLLNKCIEIAHKNF